jgi:hypothetical protein
VKDIDKKRPAICCVCAARGVGSIVVLPNQSADSACFEFSFLSWRLPHGHADRVCSGRRRPVRAERTDIVAEFSADADCTGKALSDME